MFFELLSFLLTILVASTDIEIVSPNNNTIKIKNNISQETTVTVATEAESPEKNKTSITITNAIEPTMLKYKHWTGTYSPEIFIITINGITIDSGQTYILDSCQTPLVVQFDYSFMNGIRKGSKKISYQLNKEITQAQLTFSWLDTWKVIIDNATPLKEII
jgi:hypothetical protein